MLPTIETISILAGLSGVLFGFLAWRKADNASAERLGIIETKLGNILDDLKCLIEKIDKSDSRFNLIDQKIAKLEEQVKTCFNLLKKEK